VNGVERAEEETGFHERELRVMYEVFDQKKAFIALFLVERHQQITVAGGVDFSGLVVGQEGVLSYGLKVTEARQHPEAVGAIPPDAVDVSQFRQQGKLGR